MKNVLLIDFGSTYTKVVAVDIENERLLGSASAYTTVQTDINDGLGNALDSLYAQTGALKFIERYACSSAAGGLRMLASGLVPDLTAKAAKTASLGAGAKVLRAYSYELTRDDADEIAALKPDIFLLVGGTDGGNKACILHNAEVLAAIDTDFPVIIAGNRSASRDCAEILKNRTTYICENVMPRFGVLNVHPVQERIRALFLERIIRAKGLTKARELVSGILMPTPAAMMKAMELLANGNGGEGGIGELVALDVGGATTDVYSIADGMPSAQNTVYKGLPEPYTKRTVEGDIGMRYSIRGIVEAAGIERVAALAGVSLEQTATVIDEFAEHTDRLAGSDPVKKAVDFALASLAIETAMRRHAGSMEETYTMMGVAYMQCGKDLRAVKRLIVTGGSLIHTERTNAIVSNALFSPKEPMSLRPLCADVLVDRKYILASMGLLAEHYPITALRIMKKELENNGNCKQTVIG